MSAIFWIAGITAALGILYLLAKYLLPAIVVIIISCAPSVAIIAFGLPFGMSIGGILGAGIIMITVAIAGFSGKWIWDNVTNNIRDRFHLG